MTSSYTDWSRTGTRNRRSTRSAGAAPDRRSAAGSTSAGPPRCATTATLLAQVAGRPGDRAARPDPGYQHVDTAAGVLPDLRPGRAVVGVRIRPVVACRGIHARSPSRASSCSAAAITPGIPSRTGLNTTVAPSDANTCRRSTLAVPGITIAHDSPRTARRLRQAGARAPTGRLDHDHPWAEHPPGHRVIHHAQRDARSPRAS